MSGKVDSDGVFVHAGLAVNAGCAPKLILPAQFSHVFRGLPVGRFGRDELSTFRTVEHRCGASQ